MNNNKISIGKIIQIIQKNENINSLIADELDVNPKDLNEYISNQIHSTVKIHIDGGSRGNPGDGGAGVVLEKNSRKKGYYYYLGKVTNNEAEYQALINALELLEKLNFKNTVIFTDSQLLANQINGSYKVKSDTLKKYHENARALIGKLSKFTITYIPREENKDADYLANKAMDLKSNGEIELAVARPLK